MQGIYEVLVGRPELAWSLAIPQYFFFTGVSAAAFLISSLTYVFGQERYRPIAGLSLIVALTVLLAAPLNLIADLEQPGRFYSLMLRRHATSPMSWGVFLLTAYPLLIAVEMLFAFRASFARRAARSDGLTGEFYRLLALGSTEITPQSTARDHRVSRALGIVGIPMALAVHGYTGFILYFVVGRPLWHTPLMPVIFLVSAVVSGLGLMILLTRLLVPREDGRPDWPLMERLGVLMAWSIALDVALRFAWHGLAYARQPEVYAPVLGILFGDHFFETVVVELGLTLLLPAVVAATPRLRQLRPLFLTSAFLTVAGVWFFRWSTVIGGQEIPKLGAGMAEYVPAMWGGKGVMQVVANWALWVFLLIVFTWVIPWRQRAHAGRPA